MSGVKNVFKSSEGWNLMWWWMMLPNQSWCSMSFIPHYSFHLALLCTCLSLTSPFPVTNIVSFRTVEQVWSPPESHQMRDLPSQCLRGPRIWTWGHLDWTCWSMAVWWRLFNDDCRVKDGNPWWMGSWYLNMGSAQSQKLKVILCWNDAW